MSAIDPGYAKTFKYDNVILLRALREVYEHNKGGDEDYLFGKFNENGFWYFFPVVLAIKTPIGFLVLGSAGLVLILWPFRSNPWQLHLTALFPMAILLFCMAAKINLGVRHILAIYPLLALVAGHATS
jgi:hypothetical protein